MLAFQRASGLPATGRVDEATWTRLFGAGTIPAPAIARKPLDFRVLALTGSFDWRPGAVSWIFTRRGRPDGADRGLGDPAGLAQVGVGLTAVNLHFEEDESIELGLGPSLSLLGNRIIFGGGFNLQADRDRLYGFLSIRLLDLARGM